MSCYPLPTPIGNCVICNAEFVQTRSDRRVCSRKCSQRLRYLTSDESEYCPLCEIQVANPTLLARHMRQEHNRLILTKDINAAEAGREARYLAIQREIEEMDLATCDPGNSAVDSAILDLVELPATFDTMIEYKEIDA